MDIDTLHSDLRKRLDVLGFSHPLPLGAIGIVSAILDDLIKTSEKLKSSKQQIHQLHQEKAAWELGVEPYKCDNSRLLAECNDLHLELVKQRDKFVLANTELKCRVRNLQTDRKQLEERCLLAEAKLRELHAADGKSKKDGVNMQRKPFVSTVRAGYYQPPACCSAEQRESRCCCPCKQTHKTDILHEIERLQVETKNQTEVIEAYKKQCQSPTPPTPAAQTTSEPQRNSKPASIKRQLSVDVDNGRKFFNSNKRTSGGSSNNACENVYTTDSTDPELIFREIISECDTSHIPDAIKNDNVLRIARQIAAENVRRLGQKK